MSDIAPESGSPLKLADSRNWAKTVAILGALLIVFAGIIGMFSNTRQGI